MVEPSVKARQIAEHLLGLHAAPPASLPRERAPSIDYPRLQRHFQWFENLVALYRSIAEAVAEQVTVDADDEPDELVDVVRRAHRIVLRHPVAAKSAYAALAAQGRAFAVTPEGRALRDRLVDSRRLRRASLVWRSLTMGMLDECDPSHLPATYLDNLLRAIDRPDLEQLLGMLHLRQVAR
jgi:hypothetical protein